MNHPQRLGKYSITGVLGEGAMGVVYRGFDPDIRRVVALKTIRRQHGEGLESAATGAARFRNEAQAAGRLQHPGIVGVYDFGDDGRVAYIAMEYVEGQTLARYLAQRVRFSHADIACLAGQLLDALAHAHEHGVWHRDIKPSNVIMTRSGRVKIADFGIARTDNGGLTMANSVLGTPLYMAPEQFMGLAIDHRVDLYATGVLLYQLLAGRPPFVGPSESLMFKVINEIPPPPSLVPGAAVAPDAVAGQPARFDAIVATALAKDPEARFADATAFHGAVAAALGQPLAAAVSPQAVLAVEAPTAFPRTERITPPPSTATALTKFDPKALAEVEASLARHVGPLAGVMVRRAARECSDLPTLHMRLAEQITQAAARDAFLGLASRSGGGTGSRSRTGSGVGAGGTTGGPAGSGRFATATHYAPALGGPPVSDAQLERAQHLLALQLGPIARVVVKRAAERTRQRDALFALLAESVPEPARQRFLADLARLG